LGYQTVYHIPEKTAIEYLFFLPRKRTFLGKDIVFAAKNKRNSFNFVLAARNAPEKDIRLPTNRQADADVGFKLTA